jgi:hypothetical protein
MLRAACQASRTASDGRLLEPCCHRPRVSLSKTFARVLNLAFGRLYVRVGEVREQTGAGQWCAGLKRVP